MNNIHGARLNRDTLEPKVGLRRPPRARLPLLANDSWSQIISMKHTHGQVYFIDWYDRQQCHHKGVEVHDRTNGRIFKLSYGDAKPAKLDLSKLPSPRLLELIDTSNEWYVNHAPPHPPRAGVNLAVATTAMRGYLAAPTGERASAPLSAGV